MENGYLLEAKGISKSYGGVEALKDVSLTVGRREILAVVGDNGAGKSTLMKIISGAVVPEGGEVLFEGRSVSIRSPQDSMALGIQMCYQHLALVDCLSIPKNLFLGREITRSFLNIAQFRCIRKMQELSIQHLKSLGIVVGNINQKVRNLSGGQRQVIAISRAVYWGSKLIILDEPTAALGVRESRKVLDLIRTLKDRDISVIIISHNLHHVFSIADRVMVLRRGRNAGERPIKDTDGDEVVKMITGAEFSGQESLDESPDDTAADHGPRGKSGQEG